MNAPVTNERAYTYRDGRLRSLPLQVLNGVGAGCSALGWSVPSLSPADILAAVQQRTGLSDYGGDDYREPLERYVASAEAEAQLTTLGRLAARNMLVNALSNRLQIIDWSKRHPQAADERIERPWIVLGLPRTGTSLLSLLLGLDPGCRPLLQWEAARPMPPADLATAGEDPRIAMFSRDMQRMLQLNPSVGAMHPFGSMLAEECTALFMYALRTIGMEVIAFVPGYGRWLAGADTTPAYALHKKVLQALQSTQPTERWVLKSPNHLWSLDALLATYADARIVWLHRDPGAVVTSLASINNAMQLTFTNRHDPKRVADYWADKVDDGIARASAFDRVRGPGWCYHLHYEDLVADPAGAVERIYGHFDESVASLHRRRMRAWLQHRPQNAFGKHLHDPGDFGWTLAELEERYRDYRERYAIRAAVGA